MQTVRAGGDELWETVTEQGERRLSPVVIVATGHYNEPVVPRWPRLDDYTGRVVHSKEYSSGKDFAGQDVLVVGLGNSGAEIATDLVEQGAASVAVAVRTPPPIVLREMFGGVPVRLLGIALTPLGMPRVVDRVGAVAAPGRSRRPESVRHRSCSMVAAPRDVRPSSTSASSPS